MPWDLLGILYIVCAVMCAVGFYKFVYFLSIGYGFAVAGGGVAILVMYLLNPTATPLWIVLAQTALFIAYGARLSGFIIPAGRMRRLARPFFALIRFGYVSGRLRTAVRFFLCKHRPKTVRRDKNTVLFLPFCGILTCNVKTHTRKERFPYGREETRKFY